MSITTHQSPFPLSAGFTTSHLQSAAVRIAAAAQSAADELNAADGQLGDGDLGITVSKGWQQIADESTQFPPDVGMAFLKCAQAFQKASSSSYGTLTATAFMAAAKACKGRAEIPWTEVSMLVEQAAAAMLARGKSALGDKTVVDVLNAIAKSTRGLNDPAALKSAAISACDATLAEFHGKPNRVGRARMFADKSKTLDDPGMIALRRVLGGL